MTDFSPDAVERAIKEAIAAQEDKADSFTLTSTITRAARSNMEWLAENNPRVAVNIAIQVLETVTGEAPCIRPSACSLRYTDSR